MKFNSLLFAGVLAIFTLSIASAKTYEITLSSPTKVGSVQLKPGEYRLTVSGSKATFFEVQSAKSFTTEVKVETTNTKFDSTKIDSAKQGDTSVIKDIQLGGSKTQIDF
ncbi:MAG TPA: hypothetical protein VLY04_07550 [Bryobacteraceae bacterium]|nr:hypothetical protein [Bryobacteraceae bacterium]